MGMTTIKVRTETKGMLNQLRENPGESYDLLVRKAVAIVRKARRDPKLSQQTVKEIDAARKRFARGEYYTEKEAWKLLGVDDA